VRIREWFQPRRPPEPKEAAAGASLVVGLGNPGSRYAATRHNIGFRIIDHLATRCQAGRPRRQFQALVYDLWVEDRRTLLLKPQTYMNRSGEAVAVALTFFHVEPENLLVICDDLHLPLGKLRFRRKGSDGGHKGLRSIITELGTEDFPRLRVGIGSPPPLMTALDYVLTPFRPEEQALVPAMVELAAEGLRLFLREGIEAAMNRFN